MNLTQGSSTDQVRSVDLRAFRLLYICPGFFQTRTILKGTISLVDVDVMMKTHFMWSRDFFPQRHLVRPPSQNILFTSIQKWGGGIPGSATWKGGGLDIWQNHIREKEGLDFKKKRSLKFGTFKIYVFNIRWPLIFWEQCYGRFILFHIGIYQFTLKYVNFNELLNWIKFISKWI